MAAQLYAITGILLFGIGFWGVGTLQDLVRKVVAVNTMRVGVFLTIVAFGYRQPPETPDAVPHAMVLTGIVVSVSATALALVLVRRIDEGDSAPQSYHSGDGYRDH